MEFLFNSFFIYNCDFISSLSFPVNILGEYLDIFLLIYVSTFVLPFILYSKSTWEGIKKVGNMGSKTIITSAAGKKLYDDFFGGNNQGNNSNSSGNNQSSTSGGSNNNSGDSGNNKNDATGGSSNNSGNQGKTGDGNTQK